LSQRFQCEPPIDCRRNESDGIADSRKDQKEVIRFPLNLLNLVPRFIQIPSDHTEDDKDDQDFESEEKMLFVHAGYCTICLGFVVIPAGLANTNVLCKNIGYIFDAPNP
jgi:hypothetical protein